VTGFEDDEYESDEFRPVPHPDDRLWRHPSEVAASIAAASAAAADHDSAARNVAGTPTVELPTAQPRSLGRSREGLHRGLVATAVAVAVGASALSLGLLTAEPDRDTAIASSAARPVNTEQDSTQADETIELETYSSAANSGTVDLPIAAPTNTAETQRLPAHVAASLPRIQAATTDGMREGGGVFVSSDGLIATSASLIAESDYVVAWTHDGRRWAAEVVAFDAFSDVALLQVEAPSPPAPFNLDSDSAAIESQGHYALVIDYESDSILLGEVAESDNESIHPSVEWHEFGDQPSRIAINTIALPGSAIVDDTGQVIALVNERAVTNSDLNATPAWMVHRVVDDLLADGVAVHPWLGVQAESGPAGSEVRIVEVIDGSPADLAGLRSGDLVDSINHELIEDPGDFWRSIQQREPGDRISLSVTRNGERRLVWCDLARLDG